MADVIDYASPGPFTSLDGVNPLALESAATDPVGICVPVRDLFIQPTDAQPLDLPARVPENRVVGTCRHFALLDELASVCATDDLAAVSALYKHEDLRVPEHLVR